jgi:radical SAM superfamily enzyme
MYLVSVIIPIFNRHNYVDRAVQSVLMQSNENVADYVGGSKIKFMLIYPNVSKKCIARVVKVNKEMKNRIIFNGCIF